MMTILIFGAAVLRDGRPSTTSRCRVEAASAHAKADPAARFVPTPAAGRHGSSEASVRAAPLPKSGVASDGILLEDSGFDSLSAVRAIWRSWREQRLQGHVMVATSAWHLPRRLPVPCLFGMAARPCRPPPEALGSRHCYRRLRRAAASPHGATPALWARLTGRL
jgi:vancomycin permeability regulator SanA